MKIMCKKAELVKGVQVVSKAVGTKSKNPILECILVDATSKQIKLVANDMELGIETYIEGMIEEAGSVAIHAKVFGEIVRKLPDSQVVIQVDEKGEAFITCDKVKFNLSVKPGEEFIKLPDLTKEDSIVISEFALKEAIRQTIFSVSAVETNKIMSGELFEIAGNMLKVVSLDGHRISVRKIKLKKKYDAKKVIVPGKTLTEISKIIGGNPEKEVKIYFTENHILFEFGKTIAVSRLIEGEYYKIDQMLQGDFQTKTKVNKKGFLECVDRATLLLKESDRQPIVMNIQEKGLELQVRSKIGSMNEKLAVTKEGNELSIGFNPRFLLDTLRAIDDDEVEMRFITPKAPCLIEDKEKTYTYLILPVNLTKAA